MTDEEQVTLPTNFTPPGSVGSIADGGGPHTPGMLVGTKKLLMWRWEASCIFIIMWCRSWKFPYSSLIPRCISIMEIGMNIDDFNVMIFFGDLINVSFRWCVLLPCGQKSHMNIVYIIGFLICRNLFEFNSISLCIRGWCLSLLMFCLKFSHKLPWKLQMRKWLMM